MQPAAEQQILPSLPLCRHNCHSSLSPYMCYLSSTTQIKVVKFCTQNPKESPKIVQISNISIPLQPVKCLSLNVVNGKVYVGVALVTKGLVYEVGKGLVMEDVAVLDANIVEFMNGVVAVQRVDTGFVFVSRKGNITTYTIPNTQKQTHKLTPSQPICSMLISQQNLYLGTQTGKIIHFNLPTSTNPSSTELQCFDTTSQFPIIFLVLLGDSKEIVACTCQGQLYMLSQDLKNFASISAHRAAISRIYQTPTKIYTVGDDGVLNKWAIAGPRKLKLEQSRSLEAVVSLIFGVGAELVFLCYYQSQAINRV